MSLLDEGEHSRGDGGPLGSKGRHQQVEGYAAVTIATEEGHEKPKTNEDHDVDILEDCGGKREGGREVGGWGGREVRGRGRR